MPLPEFNSGFQVISEMSRDALIEEIQQAQRERLVLWEDEQLRSLVIDMRLQSYRHRLMNEAGIEPKPVGFIQFPEE